MATYVLIHGAGSDGWYWHLVAPKLEALGHDVVAPDLPCDDDRAGLEDYVQTVVDAVADTVPHDDFIIVGQSLAGFTAPIVAQQTNARELVFVNAMIPRPGESPGEWWVNTGHVFPDPFDPEVVFMHDVPPAVARESLPHLKEQSGAVFENPWPLAALPDIATRAIVCTDDRFFPVDFQRRVVRERLGIDPEEMRGGHLPALARPDELAEQLTNDCRDRRSR